MPALVGCGLVSALFTILQVAGLVKSDEGIGMILYGVGQTCMYFMPIIIGGSAAQFFGVSPYLGNAVGGALMYSTFIEAAGAETTTKLFGLIPVTFSNYSGTLLPAIVSVWVASVLYKFFKKVIPDIVSYAFAPLCTLAIALPQYVDPSGSMMSVVGYVLSNAVGFIISFILTMIWKFDPDESAA